VEVQVLRWGGANIRERGEVGLDEYGEILYNKKAMSLRGGQTARL
jgi:hypothetical protein